MARRVIDVYGSPRGFVIVNRGNQSVGLGDSEVAAAIGFRLYPGDAVAVSTQDAVWSTPGTLDVLVLS